MRCYIVSVMLNGIGLESMSPQIICVRVVNNIYTNLSTMWCWCCLSAKSKFSPQHLQKMYRPRNNVGNKVWPSKLLDIGPHYTLHGSCEPSSTGYLAFKTKYVPTVFTTCWKIWLAGMQANKQWQIPWKLLVTWWQLVFAFLLLLHNYTWSNLCHSLASCLMVRLTKPFS